MSCDDRVVAWLASVRQATTQWGSFAVLGSPQAAEVTAALGFDFILVDLQHGLVDWGDVVPLLRAVEGAGAAPIVRVPSADPAMVGRALDLGAWAVVVPMIETSEQANRMVAAAQYPPRGVRSFGPVRSRAVRHDGPRCFAMVETVAGVENIDEIVAVEGLLGVFVGPSDLGLSLGLGFDYDVADPSHDQAVRTIAEACSRTGVAAAIQTGSAAEARLRASQGFGLVSMRSDSLLLRTAASAMLDAIRTST